MVGNQLEQEIIALYNRDITAFYSINQIAKELGKSYPYINKKVNNLIDEGVLKKKEIGRSHLCTINLENDEAIWLLVLNEIQRKKELLKEEEIFNSILKLTEKIRKTLTLHLVIRTEEEVIFLIENIENTTWIVNNFPATDYRLRCMTREEFQQEILEERSILHDHTILYGFEQYYHVLRNIQDKLRLRYSQLLE